MQNQHCIELETDTTPLILLVPQNHAHKIEVVDPTSVISMADFEVMPFRFEIVAIMAFIKDVRDYVLVIVVRYTHRRVLEVLW